MWVVWFTTFKEFHFIPHEEEDEKKTETIIIIIIKKINVNHHHNVDELLLFDSSFIRIQSVDDECVCVCVVKYSLK